MADYTDQFTCFDPMEFEAENTFALLVSWFATEAKAFVPSERTREQMIMIAEDVESFIAKNAPDIRTAFTYDDILVLNNLDRPVVLSDRIDFPIRPWEPYIVFCLWNLIDAADMSYYPKDDEGYDAAVITINVSIASAANALQCAYRVAEQRRGENAMTYEAILRSNAARLSTQARWKTVYEHKKFALSLAPSIKGRSRMAVARAINDDLQVRFGTEYSDETIDKWLKQSGWSKTI